jgi:hypothetical protein
VGATEERERESERERSRVGGRGPASSISGSRLTASYCEHENKYSDFIKSEEFLDCVSDSDFKVTLLHSEPLDMT